MWVCVDWLAGAFGDSVRVGIHTIYVYVEIAKPITLVKRLIIRNSNSLFREVMEIYLYCFYFFFLTLEISVTCFSFIYVHGAWSYLYKCKMYIRLNKYTLLTVW